MTNSNHYKRRCPFCGGAAESIRYLDRYENGEAVWLYAIKCSTGQISCAVCPQTKWFQTEEEAVVAWNGKL